MNQVQSFNQLWMLKRLARLAHTPHKIIRDHPFKTSPFSRGEGVSPLLMLADSSKEVCKGGVACSLLKLGSLEKTVIASLFHSGLHLSSPFFVEKTTLHDILPS